jgi:acyl-CoA dehydrogenase
LVSQPPTNVAEDVALSSLLARVRAFLREEVFPLEREFLSKPFGELIPVLREKRERVKTQGLWAPQIPREYGGAGLGLVEFARVSEELGQTPLGHYLFNCQAPDAGNMEVLMAHATPEQKELYLQPLLRGEVRSCFSMTEPEHPGSNPTWMSTTATVDGDDYVINGHKWFTSSADGAAFAIVMAVTDPEASSPYRRASQIIVPTDTLGFRLVRNVSVMGHEGDDYASHAEVYWARKGTAFR